MPRRNGKSRDPKINPTPFVELAEGVKKLLLLNRFTCELSKREGNRFCAAEIVEVIYDNYFTGKKKRGHHWENLLQDDLESTEPLDLGNLAGYEADLKEYRMASQPVSSGVLTISESQRADQDEDVEEVNSNESGIIVILGYNDSSTEVDTQPLKSEQESSEEEN
ncbi:hypothetical protein BDZ91DRAFT_779058 [Kalaharituber pfeilii]|nr:hypothetical protein BDZ91DRAFT_779058 [Kalaharituber pfeilii]